MLFQKEKILISNGVVRKMGAMQSITCGITRRRLNESHFVFGFNAHWSTNSSCWLANFRKNKTIADKSTR